MPRFITAAVALLIQIKHPATCHQLYLSVFMVREWGLKAMQAR